jgi:hypothetical protein
MPLSQAIPKTGRVWAHGSKGLLPTALLACLPTGYTQAGHELPASASSFTICIHQCLSFPLYLRHASPSVINAAVISNASGCHTPLFLRYIHFSCNAHRSLAELPLIQP